jgi:hypothetical protein
MKGSSAATTSPMPEATSPANNLDIFAMFIFASHTEPSSSSKTAHEQGMMAAIFGVSDRTRLATPSLRTKNSRIRRMPFGAWSFSASLAYMSKLGIERFHPSAAGTTRSIAAQISSSGVLERLLNHFTIIASS